MNKYIEQEAVENIICDICERKLLYCPSRDITDCEPKEKLKAIPAAEVVSKAEYDKLLTAAKAMHTWIFLNTVDEFEVYDECGLTDEMNALLGSMGRFELKQEADDGPTD